MVVMVINGALFSSVTSQYGGPAIFDSNFDTRDLNLASHVPNFYRHILTLGRSCTLRSLPPLRTTRMKLFRTTVV